jgi:hypothetical protein
VLRLLDLTQRKKWVNLRRNQKKLCSSEFPETSSTPYSRQGTYSRLSGLSNVTGYNQRMIPRTFSQPQPPPTEEHVQPRLVKSAHCCTVTQRRENVVKELKRASYPCTSQERRANSRIQFEQTKAGVGVFLSLDIIEKGQSAVSLDTWNLERLVPM